MRVGIAVVIAAVAFGGARVAKHAAARVRPAELADAPYAPSQASAPFLTLGYRELAADLLMIRMLGYFGSSDNEAGGIASLAEAITTIDPSLRRAYNVGAIAMTAAKQGVTNSIHLRAISLLERGAKQFPSDYRLPNLAGQIYLVDLQTKDPALRREWDQKGALLLESAARKPGAPADSAMHAAVLQSRFGQTQRAIEGLREILLITTDQGKREAILKQLAELAGQNADEIAAELTEARNRFMRQWHRERPAVPATTYLLIGARIAPGFDLGALATGGDIIGSDDTFERLEPLDDVPTTAPVQGAAP